MHGLAFRLHDAGAAERALLRHLERLRAGLVLAGRTDDLRDDVARALHDDHVAFADVLAVDVLLVVQGRARHGDAADLDRLQQRPGIECARAADANEDPVQARRRRHRRPFERARPAWTLVQRTESALLLERVHLDHDAVDLVVELDALLLPVRARTRDRLDRVVQLRERIRAEAVLAQPLQRVPVPVRRQALLVPETVNPDRERAARGDRRVLLAERAGGRVARVRRG